MISYLTIHEFKKSRNNKKTTYEKKIIIIQNNSYFIRISVKCIFMQISNEIEYQDLYRNKDNLRKSDKQKKSYF